MPVTMLLIVVGAPSATNPAKIMETMYSPTTTAMTGWPYLRNASPKKVPIRGWKLRAMDTMPVLAVMEVP